MKSVEDCVEGIITFMAFDWRVRSFYSIFRVWSCAAGEDPPFALSLHYENVILNQIIIKFLNIINLCFI